MYKVLLIDDEPSALEAMELWIDWQALGYEIVGTCANGQAGLQMIRELAPDLVITDVNMPLLSGLEMVAAWQQAGGRETKFAILSGYSEFEYAQTAIRYGIHHYLLKPVFPEEAGEELRQIRLELEQEAHSRKCRQLAVSEEAAAFIKGLLLGQPSVQAAPELLAGLPEDPDSWSVCLILTETQRYAEVRGQAAALLTGIKGAVLADMEAGCCAVVLGSASAEEGRRTLVRISDALRQECPDIPLFMASGDNAAMLNSINYSYQTAKETLQHFFYRAPAAGLLMYEEIRDTPFSSDYGYIRLADELAGFVNTLDLTGFRQAAHSAAGSFRAQQVSPGTVKKFIIHLIYRIRELAPPPEDMRQENLGEHHLSELTSRLLTLERLMDYLLAAAEAGIGLLLQERGRRSHDVVRDINLYIREHYRESLTIQRLAEIFYLHPVYLGQLLIKKNGMGFNELLHSLRIEEAVKLLEERRLKLSEIAEKVGYANYGQFLKQFEKKMHLSPNEYRQAKS
ncbi:response regulator [Paenibacillus sp. FSL R7-0345]|uniref:response regulator transcription factor n=1 Tax=Paenibacillus sp. FSL R7-0345 TaxID=2954535 RepID=UPI003159DCCC